MAVLGTIMSDYTLYNTYRLSLRKEIFADKKNMFIFGLMEEMIKAGESSLYPYDIFKYTHEKEVKYGNMVNFCSYLCEVSSCWDLFAFQKNLKELVSTYLKSIGYGKR